MATDRILMVLPWPRPDAEVFELLHSRLVGRELTWMLHGFVDRAHAVLSTRAGPQTARDLASALGFRIPDVLKALMEEGVSGRIDSVLRTEEARHVIRSVAGEPAFFGPVPEDPAARVLELARKQGSGMIALGSSFPAAPEVVERSDVPVLYRPWRGN